MSNSITAPLGASFSAVGDTSGYVYLTVNNATTNVLYAFWNGSVWTPQTIISSTGVANSYISVSTDGTNAWVFYPSTQNLAAGSKLVYKKGSYPFTASEFDANASPVASYHAAFDKAWSYASTIYTDVTASASNSASADVSMVTGVGDSIYFGKTAKFDSASWTLSTNGVNGVNAWEYWNGGTWTTLTFTTSNNTNFQGSGYGVFTAPADWATTVVNGESTPYYYVRARVTTLFTTSPVGTQMVAYPQTTWGGVAPYISANTLYALWTENSTSFNDIHSSFEHKPSSL